MLLTCVCSQNLLYNFCATVVFYLCCPCALVLSFCKCADCQMSMSICVNVTQWLCETLFIIMLLVMLFRLVSCCQFVNYTRWFWDCLIGELCIKISMYHLVSMCISALCMIMCRVGVWLTGCVNICLSACPHAQLGSLGWFSHFDFSYFYVLDMS